MSFQIRILHWQRLLRSLLADRDAAIFFETRFATGWLPPALAIEDWSAEPHSGSDFGAFHAWGIAMFLDELPNDPRALIREYQPGFAQRFVVILVGGPNRSSWRAWVCHRGSVDPVEKIVALDDPRLVLTTDSTTYHQQDDSRVRPVLGVAAEAVNRSRVMIVGTSGNGVPAALHLAPQVEGLILVDPDLVESHNLERMLIATPGDIGKNKALVLANHVSQSFPNLGLYVFSKPFDHRNSYPHNVDLIVTCVDERDEVRLMASHFARQRMIPHLDIGTGVSDSNGSMGADIRFLLPSVCIGCVGGLLNLERAEYLFNAPRGAIHPERESPWNALRVGTSMTNNQTAVAVAIQTWFDYLAGRKNSSAWYQLLWNSRDDETARVLTTESLNAEGDRNCSLCKRS